MIRGNNVDIIFYSIISIILLFGFYQIHALNRHYDTIDANKKPKISLFIRALITVSIFLLFFSFVLPFFLSKSFHTENLTKLNEIGDAMGGIMNPFIAIAAVIVTSLAFWAQYEANQEVRNQFKLQQFESHVYKLADIYRDNVARWKKYDKKMSKEFSDRLVAISILETYNVLFQEMICFCRNWKRQNRNVPMIKEKYCEKLIKIQEGYNEKAFPNRFYYRWVLSELTYMIIFFGVEERGIDNLKRHLKDCHEENFLNDLFNFFSYKVVSLTSEKSEVYFDINSNEGVVYTTLNNNNIGKLFLANTKNLLSDNKAPYKYYNGTETLFSHHYRHLHNAYKYINNSKGITYMDKWDVYAKLIRTQMSNAEQILFFINSISIIGRESELKHETSRFNPDKNLIQKRLITKYDIIKNIPRGDREDYQIEDFYPDVEWEDMPMDNPKYESRYAVRKKLDKDFYSLDDPK